MPDYKASYWNGTTEVEVSEKDNPSRYFDVEPRLQQFCSTTVTCGTTVFASTVTPGPLLVPGAHVTPGGVH